MKQRFKPGLPTLGNVGRGQGIKRLKPQQAQTILIFNTITRLRSSALLSTLSLPACQPQLAVRHVRFV
jgi:hypothetical protein